MRESDVCSCVLLCADSPGSCRRHPQIIWGLWNGHLIYHQQPWHRQPGFLKGQVTPTEIPNQTRFLLAGQVALLQDSAECVQLCRNDFGFICKMELSSRLRLKTFSTSVSSSEPVMILCHPPPNPRFPLPPTPSSDHWQCPEIVWLIALSRSR